LVERLVLALTNPGDLVVDPYLGVGSTACAAVLHGRRAAGADTVPEYIKAARVRIQLALDGSLKRRPMGRPIHVPGPNDQIVRRPKSFPVEKPNQQPLFVHA